MEAASPRFNSGNRIEFRLPRNRSKTLQRTSRSRNLKEEVNPYLRCHWQQRLALGMSSEYYQCKPNDALKNRIKNRPKSLELDQQVTRASTPRDKFDVNSSIILIQYLLKNATREEGLFRIPGSKENVRKVHFFLVWEKGVLEEDSITFHDVASALKCMIQSMNIFFRESAKEYYLSAGRASSKKNAINLLLQALLSIKPEHQRLLKELCALFGEIVKNHHQTKLNAASLAGCIGPSLIFEDENSEKEKDGQLNELDRPMMKLEQCLIQTKECNKALTRLIKYRESIFKEFEGL